MTDAHDRWPEIGATIERRIAELKLTKAEVIRLSEISDKTLAGYIRGAPIVRADKRRNLCTALLWTDDSIELMLEGGDPVEVHEPERRLRELREHLRGRPESKRSAWIDQLEALEEELLRYFHSANATNKERIVRFAGEVVDEEAQDWVEEYGVPGDPELTGGGTVVELDRAQPALPGEPGFEDLGAAAEHGDASGAQDAPKQPRPKPDEPE